MLRKFLCTLYIIKYMNLDSKTSEHEDGKQEDEESE